MTSQQPPPGAPVSGGAVERLVQLFSSGDFDGDESRRLAVELRPLSFVLRAVERMGRARGEAGVAHRVAAWRDVRAAVEAAPRDGLVLTLAARLSSVLGDYGEARAAAETAWSLGTVSAGMLRYHQARNSGSFDVACAALEDVLRLKQRLPNAAISQPVAEYALEHLLALYFDHHHDEAAAATLQRHASLARGSSAIGLRAARIHARRGRTDDALSALRAVARADPSDTPSRLKAAAILLEIGAFDEARALYESLAGSSPAAVEALAQLALWTGDTARALEYADALASADAAARRIRAAVLMLRGDPHGALPLLDAVLATDPSGDAHLWHAEALLRMGRMEEAAVAADRSRSYGYSFAAGALHLLAAIGPAGSPEVAATSAPPAQSPEDARRRVEVEPDGFQFPARHELGTELTALVPEAAALLDTPLLNAELRALLERALAVMHGNRTPLGTWVRPDGTLARVPPTGAPRLLSREAFELIRVAPVDESLRRLDALAERFPHSSMPVVHRGELHLWLGHYDEARVDLERAIAIRARTRWAWYGLAWLHILTGDPERGLATCAEGIAVMRDKAYPPAYACRGEAYRLLGRLDDARAELQRACELTPTRISAWADLALVHGATGGHAPQAAIFGRLMRLAPALVAQAARELGDDVFTNVVFTAPFADDAAVSRIAPAMIDRVLAHVLRMMRGNRASNLITYFTADGRIHHVPSDGGQPSPDAEHHAVDKVRTVVRRALETRGRGRPPTG